MKVSKHNTNRRAKTRKEKEVWEACCSLKRSNNPLTYYAIGEQLIKLGYKRGSNSDIRRYLTTWKKYNTSPVLQTTASEEGSKPANPASNIQEHEPLRITLTELPASDVQLLNLAQHYVQQFDRLLKINDILRKENNHLKKMMEKEKRTEKIIKSVCKPRYTLKAIFEKVE